MVIILAAFLYDRHKSSAKFLHQPPEINIVSLKIEAALSSETSEEASDKA
jgi:hypothetical protein